MRHDRSPRRSTVLLLLLGTGAASCGGFADTADSSTTGGAGDAGAGDAGTSVDAGADAGIPRTGPTPLIPCTFNGPSPICPPFATGIESNLWGGGDPWAKQLFWQDVPSYTSTNWPPTANGYPVPLIGQIGSGVDLLEANGGATLGGTTYPDYSKEPGYKQYAAWMNAHTNLFAMASDGTIPYQSQGYITFGMPLDAADWDQTGNWSASNPETFGAWAGARIGAMILQIHGRGDFAADYFAGLNFGGIDWNPRLVSRFASWAKVTIPSSATTPAQQSAYVLQNYGPQWLDFLNMGQATYYAAMDKVIAAAGQKPMIAAQAQFDPAFARSTAEYPKAWAQQIPAGDMYFEVENESQPDRAPPPDWRITFSIGTNASLAPDVPIGVYMDGDYSDYWDAVTAAKWTKAHGWAYLKHMGLSAAWTMVANKDGSVRRAAQGFQLGNWSYGTLPQDLTDQMLGHIPTHPFGPAFYYSESVARYYETPHPNDPSYYYFWPAMQTALSSVVASDYPWIQAHEAVIQGVNLGFWMSNATDPSALKPADVPSAWLLYNADKLPAAELAKLQALAPVYDFNTATGNGTQLGGTAALAAGPVRATGAGLNVLAFIDQNGSVILMATNQDGTDQNAGALVFSNVSNGSFNLFGLLGTTNTTMTVVNNQATVPISVPAYDTVVYEIPALKWLGH